MWDAPVTYTGDLGRENSQVDINTYYYERRIFPKDMAVVNPHLSIVVEGMKKDRHDTSA